MRSRKERGREREGGRKRRRERVSCTHQRPVNGT